MYRRCISENSGLSRHPRGRLINDAGRQYRPWQDPRQRACLTRYGACLLPRVTMTFGGSSRTAPASLRMILHYRKSRNTLVAIDSRRGSAEVSPVNPEMILPIMSVRSHAHNARVSTHMNRRRYASNSLGSDPVTLCLTDNTVSRFAVARAIMRTSLDVRVEGLDAPRTRTAALLGTWHRPKRSYTARRASRRNWPTLVAVLSIQIGATKPSILPGSTCHNPVDLDSRRVLR